MRFFAGFTSRPHTGTLVSLAGFGLLALSLFLPVGSLLWGEALLSWDILSLEASGYTDNFPQFPVLVLTVGIIGQVLVATAFFATLADMGVRGIPTPGVWRMIALVIPLLGVGYVLGLTWVGLGGSPTAFLLVIPIFGFLISLAGILWQRRIARLARR
jgi:hypothetical protein